MTEAMLDSFCSSRAPLRWTPGPDERRLPSCEDEPVPQNTRQAVAIKDGFSCLSRRWRERPDVFVGADQFLYWDPAYDPRTNPENPPPVPDVYVAFDVADRHRNSYVVWEEGKPPDFVLEVVSPLSRKRDAKEKPDIYAEIGVPELFLYDPGDEDEPTLAGVGPALSGFDLLGGRGGRCRPLPRERLPGGVVGVRSKMLGLCLCVKRSGPKPLDGSLRWYDPAVDGFLPTDHQLEDANHRLSNANDRLAEENHRLAAAKRKAEARAAAFDARAKASHARANASAARVAELEALIEKMRRG